MNARGVLHLIIGSAMALVTGYLVTVLRAADVLRTWESVKFGVILVFAVTGVFAFLGYAWPLWRLLPDRYYRVAERRDALAWQRRLGLLAFRSLLLRVYWGHGRQRRQFFDGTRRGLQAMDVASRVAEFGHLASFVALLPLLVVLYVDGHRVLVSVAAFVNVPFHLYPVLLQRWHRARIGRLRRRLPAGAT